MFLSFGPEFLLLGITRRDASHQHTGAFPRVLTAEWLEIVKNCEHPRRVLMELAESSVDVLIPDNCSP